MSQSQEVAVWFNALVEQVGPGMREGLARIKPLK
jgi:hypothetical protein